MTSCDPRFWACLSDHSLSAVPLLGPGRNCRGPAVAHQGGEAGSWNPLQKDSRVQFGVFTNCLRGRLLPICFLLRWIHSLSQRSLLCCVSTWKEGSGTQQAGHGTTCPTQAWAATNEQKLGAGRPGPWVLEFRYLRDLSKASSFSKPQSLLL